VRRWAKGVIPTVAAIVPFAFIPQASALYFSTPRLLVSTESFDEPSPSLSRVVAFPDLYRSHTNIKGKVIVVLSLLVFLLGAVPFAHAIFIFETATGNELPTGLALNNFFWPMHRFEITSPVPLGSVGGFFTNDSGGQRTIFGAVVALSGPIDFPNSLDLSTSDVLGVTLVNVGLADSDYSGSISLTLNPGWYTLAFGSGKFGADSIVTVPGIIMPSLAMDLSPQLPFTAVQADNPFGTPPQFINQLTTPRFFASAIPEPAAFLLLGFGLLALAAVGRKTSFRNMETRDGTDVFNARQETM